MPARPQRTRITRVEVFAAIVSWSLSIVTTAALAAVGWWGHSTHWTFGLGGHAAPHADGGHAAAGHEPETRHPADTETAGQATVQFPTREAMERTGIELVPVKERPVVSELVVSGVVQYDQRHIAQLSARVPGTVWRVEKHLGDSVRKGDVLLVMESSEVGRLKAQFLNALVSYEARREQLAILEEVKGAVLGRQLREAKSAVRESRNHLINAEQALVNLGLGVSIGGYESLDDEQPVPTAFAPSACRSRCCGRSTRAV